MESPDQYGLGKVSHSTWTKRQEPPRLLTPLVAAETQKLSLSHLGLLRCTKGDAPDERYPNGWVTRLIARVRLPTYE